MSTYRLIFLATASVILAGCSGESTATVTRTLPPAGPETIVETSQPAQISEAEPLKSEPLEESPVPQELPVMLNDGAGVLNAGFEEWLEGEPLYWQLANTLIKESETGPQEGKVALSTGPGYTYNHITQTIAVYGTLAGKRLTLSAAVRCSDPQSAFVMIKLADHLKYYSEKHPGDNEWHRLEAVSEVPEHFDGDSFTIYLSHGNRPKEPCLFDDVRLTVE